jgi:hypothetical protein
VNIRGYAASGLDVKGRGFHSSAGNLWPQNYTATTTRTTATVTTEIHFAASKNATAATTGTVLTTEILFKSTNNPLELVITKANPYVSITLRLLEPSIKDVTADREIIDFVETDERDIIQTQVI